MAIVSTDIQYRLSGGASNSDTALEAFAQTRQMRLMEQLETGMITDTECCLMLTGWRAWMI